MLTSVPDVVIAMVDAAAAKVKVGTLQTQARFVLYSGPVPGNAQSALVGGNIVLASIFLDAANPFGAAFDTPGERVAEALATPVGDTPATSDGTVTFFRQFNKNNQVIWQGTVTEVGGGGDMTLSSINLIADVNVIMQRYAIRVPY